MNMIFQYRYDSTTHWQVSPCYAQVDPVIKTDWQREFVPAMPSGLCFNMATLEFKRCVAFVFLSNGPRATRSCGRPILLPLPQRFSCSTDFR